MSRTGSDRLDRFLFYELNEDFTSRLATEALRNTRREAWFELPKTLLGVVLAASPTMCLDIVFHARGTFCYWVLFVVVSSCYVWLSSSSLDLPSPVLGAYIKTRVRGAVFTSLPILYSVLWRFAIFPRVFEG
jgi:hypothetical protein